MYAPAIITSDLTPCDLLSSFSLYYLFIVLNIWFWETLQRAALYFINNPLWVFYVFQAHALAKMVLQN